MSDLLFGRAAAIAEGTFEESGSLRRNTVREALRGLLAITDIALDVQSRMPLLDSPSQRSPAVSRVLEEVRTSLFRILEQAVAESKPTSEPFTFTLVLADRASRAGDREAMAQFLACAEAVVARVVKGDSLSASAGLVTTYIEAVRSFAAPDSVRLRTDEEPVVAGREFADLRWDTWLQHLLAIQKTLIDAAAQGEANEEVVISLFEQTGAAIKRIASDHSPHITLPESLADRAFASHPEIDASRVALVAFAWLLYRRRAADSELLAQLSQEAEASASTPLLYVAWFQAEGLRSGFGTRSWAHWESTDLPSGVAHFMSFPSLIDAAASILFSRSDEAWAPVTDSWEDIWATRSGDSFAWVLERALTTVEQHGEAFGVSSADIDRLGDRAAEARTSLEELTCQHVAASPLDEDLFDEVADSVAVGLARFHSHEALVELQPDESLGHDQLFGIAQARHRREFVSDEDIVIGGGTKELGRELARGMARGEASAIAERLVDDSLPVLALDAATDRIVSAAADGYSTLIFGDNELYSYVRRRVVGLGIREPATGRLTLAVGDAQVVFAESEAALPADSLVMILRASSAVVIRYALPDAIGEASFSAGIGDRYWLGLEDVDRLGDEETTEEPTVVLRFFGLFAVDLNLEDAIVFLAGERRGQLT